jgi:2-amino-4-hydroxy-6-hydroxymethyldihydropteridine diphosphokinase
MEELIDVELIIAFGSNLGNRENNIQKAISEIEKRIGKIQKVSSLLSSEPSGFESSNEFLNGCLLAKTTLSATEVLNILKQIESELGRATKTLDVYQDRPIDLDILFFGEEVINYSDLTIPHPRYRKREFVLNPLHEIANNLDPQTFLFLSNCVVKN